MAEYGGRRSRFRSPGLRPRAWCCSFASAPQSPDCRGSAAGGVPAADGGRSRKLPPKSPSSGSAFQSSPSKLAALGIIDPRRILSPGRVSPIDSDCMFEPMPEIADSVAGEAEAAASTAAPAAVESEGVSELGSPDPAAAGRCLEIACAKERSLDLELCLRGADGRSVTLELDSAVLCECSEVFAGMVARAADADERRVEVAGIETLDLFVDAVKLMYEVDAARWLMKAGVSRAIDILEVCYHISFDRGIRSCLNYIESVPWSEDEEEKLKKLRSRCIFDEDIFRDVLARLPPTGWSCSEDLAIRLIHSVTSGTNSTGRKEMQSLVNGLLSESSIYQKDPAGLNKESLYAICDACVNSLVDLFEEASYVPSDDSELPIIVRESKPLIERITKQVENIVWLVEILVNNQMAEQFVDLWASQEGLMRMHGGVTPMVRYEVSRISATVFLALGKGTLHCCGDTRSRVLCRWFRQLLLDFGWLQRRPKGLDMRMLEDALGQALLTLSLKQQQEIFEEWFQFFATKGAECPNLSRAFQVWWRRSFIRSL